MFLEHPLISSQKISQNSLKILYLLELILRAHLFTLDFKFMFFFFRNIIYYTYLLTVISYSHENKYLKYHKNPKVCTSFFCDCFTNSSFKENKFIGNINKILIKFYKINDCYKYFNVIEKKTYTKTANK